MFLGVNSYRISQNVARWFIYCTVHIYRHTVYVRFLANVNSSSRSLYVIDGPSVVCRLSVCLFVVCNVGAPYSGD